MGRNLYTVGHSIHSLPRFIELLKGHRVTAVCDVRSAPYSRLHPHFNREPLREELKLHRIAYVFLGEELGGRSSDRSCYDAEGRVRYGRIADTDAFRQGLARVREGIETYRIALMCAEKDPLICHRAVLICRHLRDDTDLSILHILDDGQTERHEESERRLLRLARMEQGNLFKSVQEQIEEAYEHQERRIAYREQSDNSNRDGRDDSANGA